MGNDSTFLGLRELVVDVVAVDVIVVVDGFVVVVFVVLFFVIVVVIFVIVVVSVVVRGVTVVMVVFPSLTICLVDGMQRPEYTKNTKKVDVRVMKSQKMSSSAKVCCP